MSICVASVKSTGLKCKNKAKFGDVCGVHNNSKISEAKKQTTTALMVANPADYKKQNNLDKFKKHIKKIKKEKKKSFERKLSHPSRRRSA